VSLERLYYAGIGSRKTPKNICTIMSSLAAKLSNSNYILRSGGAGGADTAFENGSEDSIIYRPKDATGDSIKLASKFHPAWDMCNGYVRKLHGRNAQIILGDSLKDPAEFVICWSANESAGGTSIGIKIARAHDIPVYNLYKQSELDLIMDFVK